MDDKNIVFLDWKYNLWDEGIEKFYPVCNKYFEAKVTGVATDRAWLVTVDGVECYLRKNKVAGTTFQVQDLTQILRKGQTVNAKVIGYNKIDDKSQLIVAIKIKEEE